MSSAGSGYHAYLRAQPPAFIINALDSSVREYVEREGWEDWTKRLRCLNWCLEQKPTLCLDIGVMFWATQRKQEQLDFWNLSAAPVLPLDSNLLVCGKCGKWIPFEAFNIIQCPSGDKAAHRCSPVSSWDCMAIWGLHHCLQTFLEHCALKWRLLLWNPNPWASPSQRWLDDSLQESSLCCNAHLPWTPPLLSSFLQASTFGIIWPPLSQVVLWQLPDLPGIPGTRQHTCTTSERCKRWHSWPCIPPLYSAWLHSLWLSSRKRCSTVWIYLMLFLLWTSTKECHFVESVIKARKLLAAHWTVKQHIRTHMRRFMSDFLCA